MIFITLGSQKFQFNRLLKEVDRLIGENRLNGDNVFAQTGYSNYLPTNFQYEKFLNKEEFINRITQSELVITHGGTGSIINSIKLGRPVIGVPRDKRYEEHVDNHQFEIINEFSKAELILGIQDVRELASAIDKVKVMKFKDYTSNTKQIISALEGYLLKDLANKGRVN